MSLVTPMPSPTGRNTERLYVLRGRPDRAHAYDAAGDDITALSPDDAGNPTALAKWIFTNLNDDERTQLVAILTETQSDVISNMAKVAARYSRPLSGLGAVPRPAGRATQRAQDEFHKMFPSAARVRQL